MLLRYFIAILFLSVPALAQSNPDWTTPFPPHRIIGNVYYVGSRDLAAYLIATPEGHILINSNLKSSPPLIRKSIETLGFHYQDVKVLLISHAHSDHCAGSAQIRRETGAKYMVMDADIPSVESGGKSDFRYGRNRSMLFPAAKVDRVLHDGDEVKLGNVTLIAHLTAGHTKGCTTWTLSVADHGKIYHVVIVGGPNVNSGYKLVSNAKYPQIADDYKRQFQVLHSLPCDIFLGAHGLYYDMLAKFEKLTPDGANPFIDPQGYKDYIDDREQAFLAELKQQSLPATK